MAISVAASSCDDEDTVMADQIHLEGVDDVWHLDYSGGTAIIRIYSSSSNWKLEESEDWIGVSSTLGSSGESILVSVGENDNSDRETEITFVLVDQPSVKRTIRVVQTGFDTDTGTLTHDLQRKHALGYGYNIMKGYADDKSFSANPILDYSKIEEYEHRTGIEVIEENRRHSLELKVFSSSTLKGLSKDLSFDMTNDEVSIFGCGETTYSSSSIYEQKSISDYCGYIRSSQIESTRSIDLGALQSIISSIDSEFFSDSFRTTLNRAVFSGDCTELFSEFGTHLVVSADLGGCISIKAIATRESAIDKETAMHFIAEKTLEARVGFENEKLNYQREHGLNYRIDVEAKGGDQSLINEIKASFTSSGKIDKSVLSKWYKSYSLTTDGQYNAAMVDCQLIPLYDIFGGEHVKRILLEGFSQYTEGISIHPSDQGPTYTVDTEGFLSDLLSDTKHNTIVLKPDGQDRAIISYEYVPAVRKDRRVFVAYPILDGKIDFFAGLFLGDESHCPGKLRWMKYNTLYEPEMKYARTEDNKDMFNSEGVLKEIYYSNCDFHIDKSSIEDESKTGTVPVCSSGDKYLASKGNFIKVGPKFWSQFPVKQRVERKDSPYKGWIIRELNGYPYMSYFISSGSFKDAIDKDIDPIWKKAKASMPKADELTLMLRMAGGRNEIFFTSDGDRNILGLNWAKGVANAPTGRKIYDDDAFLIPAVNDNNEIVFFRLSRSGTATIIDAPRYALTVLGSNVFGIYVPIYYVAD